MINMRVYHVKKARKDNPAVKKGESYYWWKFAFGPKKYSKTYPKRSQLTQSYFKSWLWDFEDSFEDRFAKVESSDDLGSILEEVKYELTIMRDEVQANLDNMPLHLQDTSESGMLMQERIDGFDEWLDILNYINLPDDEDWDDEKDDVIQEIFDSNPGIG